MIFASPHANISIPEGLSLTDYVFQHADTWSDKPALIDGPSGRTLTYRQLVGAVQKMAAGLTQHGFKKGDVFAIYSPNLPEYAVAFHGVAAVGGISTTINPLFTAGELSKQLQDAGAKYLLTTPQFLDKAQEAVAGATVEEIFVFGEAEGATPFAALLQNEAQAPDVPIEPKEDLLALPYSSGTTGLPKGVMLTHYNLVANVAQCKDIAGFDETDTLIAILPFFHIYGMLITLNLGLYKGSTVVTLPRFDLEQFLKTMQDYEVTRAYLVPPIVLALAKHPLVDQYDLSKLEIITSGAAPLSAEVSQACAERLGCVVNQGFGMTEMSPVTHHDSDDADAVKFGSIGTCLPNMECKIVDPLGNEELGVNETGELWVRGPQMMKGYLNDPQATEDSIDQEGWFHTGDIVYADEDGYFFVVDRLKEMIKYKGIQVAPAELEALLLTHPAIADAAVIPVSDEEAGEIPKAYVSLKGEVAAREIMDFVAEQVAPHKKIRQVEFIKTIPKSASGKILRRVLIEQERATSL